MSTFESLMSAADKEITKKAKQISKDNAQMAVVIGEMSTKQYMDMQKLVTYISKYSVLAGIPDETTQRKEGLISNAELAYIHTHGVTKKKQRQEIENEIKRGMNFSGARKKIFDMYILEHGSPPYKVPPRPIIEPALEANSEAIERKLNSILVDLFDMKFHEAEIKMEALGVFCQNKIRGWFVNPANKWPPNAPSTIKRKKSERPLIDTGELRKSITYVVEKPNKRF